MSEQKTQIKPFKTIEELIEILQTRGCVVSNKSFAYEILSKINYYHLKSLLTSLLKTILAKKKNILLIQDLKKFLHYMNLTKTSFSFITSYLL